MNYFSNLFFNHLRVTENITCDPGRRSRVPPEVLKALLDCIDWGVWQLILTAELDRGFGGSTLEDGLEMLNSFVDNLFSGEMFSSLGSELWGNKKTESSGTSPEVKACCDGGIVSWFPNNCALLDGREEYWYVLSRNMENIEDMSWFSRLSKFSKCLSTKNSRHYF